MAAITGWRAMKPDAGESRPRPRWAGCVAQRGSFRWPLIAAIAVAMLGCKVLGCRILQPNTSETVLEAERQQRQRAGLFTHRQLLRGSALDCRALQCLLDSLGSLILVRPGMEGNWWAIKSER
jgi:hypothetical protein